jgi:DNA adenine methylase
MRYLGGKIRQAKWLRSEILHLRQDNQIIYVEPFVGGGAVLEQLAPCFDHVLASDLVPDLILLWQAVTTGWIPPSAITREAYESLRDQKPSALRAWAGFAASYNGKWFAGYGPKASGRDYLAESQRAILRKAEAFKHAGFVCCDFADHEVDSSCVVYCDPPYANTEGYAGAGNFDHTRFWKTCDSWADTGALVLVTEYTAPSHWCEVSSISRTETMNHSGKSSGVRKETLFRRVK